MRFLSFFHRGRHRADITDLEQPRVSDIAERINSEYFSGRDREYDPDGPAWQMTSDRRYLMFTGTIGVPKEPGGETGIVCDAKQGWHTDVDD